MRVTLPPEVTQVYAGDLAAARQLEGRAVRVGVPGEARAARAENQQRLAEPPGRWKRFLNFLGLRKFTPEESYRAQTHALSGKLRDVVTRLGTGHATKDALAGPMQEIARDIKKLALAVLVNDAGMESLIGQRRNLLERLQTGGDAERRPAVDKELASVELEIGALAHKAEEAIVGARLGALVKSMPDQVLNYLHEVAEQTYTRLQSQLPNTDRESDELKALPEGPMKDLEIALRRQEYASFKQPIGLGMSLFFATGSELASRNAAPAGSPEASAPASAQARIPAEAHQAQAAQGAADRGAPEARPVEMNFSLAESVLDLFRNAAKSFKPSGAEVFDATTKREIAGTNRFLIDDRPLVEANAGDERKIEALKDTLTGLFGSQERAAKFSRLVAGQGLNMISGTTYKKTVVSLREGRLENEYVLTSINGSANRGDVETKLAKQENGDVVATMNRRFLIEGFTDDAGHSHRLHPNSFIDVSLQIKIDHADNITIDKPNSRLTYSFEPPHAR
ncbi:MAG: hypothetical protein C1943_11825 [Halochromatium sp.]|nr:hypothetical protein [Halochromatium sp.]